MIDRALIGTEFKPHTVSVERGQLAFFAKATGDDDPVYSDLDAARKAGHPDVPAPPTFAFSLSLMSALSGEPLQRAKIDIARILHGEQSFQHFHPIHAGDEITLTGRIADIYEKNGGALEFIVSEIDAVNQDGVLCTKQKTVTVVRGAER